MFEKLFASCKRPYIPGRYERELVEIDLSGSILKLELPPHHNYEGFPADETCTQVNLYDESQYPEPHKDGLERYHQEGVAAQALMTW